MEKVKKSPGFYELDYTSIKNRNQKAPASSALDARSLTNAKTQQKKLNPGEAELWQINAFLQSEKELQLDIELVLHAERVNYERSDGAKVEKIRFYTRPKIEKTEETKKGFFAFLDNLINKDKKNQEKKNQDDKNLANSTLAGLAKVYKAAAGVTASRPTLHSSLDRLIQRSASPASGSIAPDLMVVATAIGNEKYKRATETALAESSTFRDAMLAEINISYNEFQGFAERKTLEDLTSFGFQMTEIMAFDRLVSNITGRKNGDEENLHAIDRFRKQWIALHDNNSPGGQKFRDFVWNDPTHIVWSMVAHRLAGRPAPTFDLNAHAKGDVVMVPEVKYIQAFPGETTMRETISKLHSDATEKNCPQFAKTNFEGEKILVAAKGCVIDENQYLLYSYQHTYIQRAYESVFAHKAATARTIILMPLFNYTENSIDDCIDIMLAPAREVVRRGEKLSLGISTPDPRIKMKFDNAVYELIDELRKNKNETEAVAKNNNPDNHQVKKITELETQTADSPAIHESVVENMRRLITEGIETFKQHADDVQSTAPATAATVATFATQGYEALKGSLPILTPQQIFGDQNADGNVMHSTKPLVKPDTPLSVAVEVMAAKEKTGLLAVANSLADTYSGAGGHDAAVVLERMPPMQMKRKKPGSPVKLAAIVEPSAQKATSLHSATPADRGIEYVKLQTGITGLHWWPNEKTVILLSDPADECIQPGQTDIKSELNTLLKEDTFSTFCGTGVLFKPQSAKNDIPQNHNRHFVYAEKLQASATAEIAKRYTGMVEEAARIGINKLVVTPCFDRPSDSLFSDQKPYKRAIGTTIKTLDELTIKFPELDITLVARSEAEKALMQEAIQAWSQEKQRERLPTN